MSQFQVFFYEAFAEEQAALRRFLPADVAAGYSAKTIQEHGACAPEAPIISIRTQSMIPSGWAGQLTGILTRSTGYDHVSAYLRAAGCTVPSGYLPLYCNRSVAEQALLLWLALLRRLPKQMTQFRQFHRDGLTGCECAGRTLLVVGVGNIGHEVVRIGQGLGMTVLGVDLVRRWPDVTYVDITAGLPRADVVVCAMDLTAENPGYFNGDRLARTRTGAVFVNVARGELMVAADLLRLLESGHLGGVGLDVYNEEPELAVSLREGRASRSEEVQTQLRLAARPDVICTPHNAFNTLEAVERKASQSSDQIRHFLQHGRFLWPVG